MMVSKSKLLIKIFAFMILVSGNIHAREVCSKKAVAQLDGSGKIQLYVTDDLHATVNGCGSIQFWGNPWQVYRDASRSGSAQGMN